MKILIGYVNDGITIFFRSTEKYALWDTLRQKHHQKYNAVVRIKSILKINEKNYYVISARDFVFMVFFLSFFILRFGEFFDNERL